MNICGIVCEYNPFHVGHAWQISETRRLIGEDSAIVCVMSGNFVQRGEAAIFSKFARTYAAICNGVDLVLELPLPWAISSAESFAEGALGILGALKCVTHISFGSECGNLSLLNKITQLLCDPSFEQSVVSELRNGNSYAVSRQHVLENYIGSSAEVLHSPNDILAIEYLKALRKQNLPFDPILISRKGAPHDSLRADNISSASYLRKCLYEGTDVSNWIPNNATTVFSTENIINRDLIDIAILSRLRWLQEDKLAEIPYTGEGLYHRLYRAVNSCPSLEDIVDYTTTKRYPRSRIRRICLCAALNIQKGDNIGIPPYIRVLGFNSTGQKILHHCSNTSELPIITKPALIRKMSNRVNHIFTLEAKSTDLYMLGNNNPQKRLVGYEWVAKPIIIK